MTDKDAATALLAQYESARSAYDALDEEQQKQVVGYSNVANGIAYLEGVLNVYEFKDVLAGVDADFASLSALGAIIEAYNEFADDDTLVNLLTEEEKKQYEDILAAYTEVASRSVTVSFTEGTNNYYINNSQFNVNNVSYKSGAERIIDGVTYDGIKVNSKLTITFTIAADMNITVYFGESQSGSIFIDEGSVQTKTNSYNISNGAVSTTLKAGTYTITKHDTETTMFLISLTPAG